jgi:AIG2 family protein
MLRAVPPMPWYFAYGSNMSSSTLRGRRGVVPQHALPARAVGWRLVFDKPGLLATGEGFANIVAEPDAHVYGVLYKVNDADLAHIDLTEGVLIGNYQRVETTVIGLSDSARSRTASTLTSERHALGLLPSTRYMALLIEGAIEHGLPADYVEFLRAVPARPESAAAALLRPLADAFMKRRTES